MLSSNGSQLSPSLPKAVTVVMVGVVILLSLVVTMSCSGVRSTWKLGNMTLERLGTKGKNIHYI